MNVSGKDHAHMMTLRARTKQAIDKARTISRNLPDAPNRMRFAAVASNLADELVKIDLLIANHRHRP